MKWLRFLILNKNLAKKVPIAISFEFKLIEFSPTFRWIWRWYASIKVVSFTNNWVCRICLLYRNLIACSVLGETEKRVCRKDIKEKMSTYPFRSIFESRSTDTDRRLRSIPDAGPWRCRSDILGVSSRLKTPAFLPRPRFLWMSLSLSLLIFSFFFPLHIPSYSTPIAVIVCHI